MKQTEIGELLCKQLELLAERSKESSNEGLTDITLAMLEVAESLYP